MINRANKATIVHDPIEDYPATAPMIQMLVGRTMKTFSFLLCLATAAVPQAHPVSGALVDAFLAHTESNSFWSNGLWVVTKAETTASVEKVVEACVASMRGSRGEAYPYRKYVVGEVSLRHGGNPHYILASIVTEKGELLIVIGKGENSWPARIYTEASLAAGGCDGWPTAGEVLFREQQDLQRTSEAPEAASSKTVKLLAP